MDGLSLPASNVVSPSVLGHDPAVKPEAYDPEGAKKLLAQANEGGASDNITLLIVRFDPADSDAGNPGDAR